MELQVVEMKILNDYKLILTYHTGEEKFIDLKSIIFAHDCWKELQDESLFKQAFIDEFGDAPCWPNNIEMDPVEVYYASILINGSYTMAINKLNNNSNKEIL